MKKAHELLKEVPVELGQFVYRVSPFNSGITMWEVTKISLQKGYWSISITRENYTTQKNVNDIGANTYLTELEARKAMVDKIEKITKERENAKK